MSSDAEEETKVPDAVKNLITLDDVKAVAHRAFNDSTIKVSEYRLKSCSNEELGYFGSYWQLEIFTQDRHKQNNLSLFMKCLPINNQKRSDYVREQGIFLEEAIFFKDIFPQLIENYCGEKWSPLCYLAKKDVLIMENLRCQNYRPRGIFFDKTELLKSALKSLARFHSCSILMEDRLYRESKQRKTLDTIYPNSFQEKTYSKTAGAIGWLLAGINLAVAVADRLGHNGDRLRETFERIFEVVKPSAKYRNVICHGDLWTNNLMFDETTPVPKCILIDYQFIRYGPLVLDILQLIYYSTTRAYRKENEVELIRFYHSVLEETIFKNKETAETITPKIEEILTAYDDLRIFGCAIANLHFPISMLDPEINKEMSKDSKTYEEFIFGDRTDVTFAYMAKDEFYKKIIEESIGEIVEIGDRKMKTNTRHGCSKS